MLLDETNPIQLQHRQGICFVLSAPSGAGKSTIANALRASQKNLFSSVSVTTRNPRPGEKNGIHYYFLSQEEFNAQVKKKELLEWATVFDKSYGTPKLPVERQLAEGKDMIFDIDWQGHQQIKQALKQHVVGIFILPPSVKELERRLRNRAADNNEEIEKRMKAAIEEISHWREFDYVIINNRLDEAIAHAESILISESLKTSRQQLLEY